MKLRSVATPKPAPVVEPTAEHDPSFEIIGIQPTTVQRLIQRSRDIAAQCEDYTIAKANTQNVRFNEFAGLTYIPDGGEIHQSPISRYALGQLGTKIGVPSRYLEKCVLSGRVSLAQDNVNSWLESYDKSLFLREYNGGIRGVLTSKYSVCDSHEILEVVDSEVNLDRYKVKGSFLNQERLHVRLVSREMLPVDGEDLFAGLFIDSSDVGRSILTVQFGIYKQVCTNGLIVSRAGGILFQQKHVGITAAEFQSGLATSLKNVDTLAEHASEWVSLARQKKAWGYNVDALSEQEMTEFLERIRSKTDLPEAGAKKVIDLMQTKYGGTNWGLINSITEVAQDYTLEKRLGLERVAGNLLAVA